MQQVAVRGMDFENVKSACDGATRGLAILLEQGGQVALIECSGAGRCAVEGFVADGYNRPSLFAPQLHVLLVEPRSAVPWPSRRSFPTAMRQLHAGGAAEAVEEIRDAFEVRHLRVEP